MQAVYSAFSNIRNNHNDRKNDTILYYVTFSLYIIVTSCGIFTAPFITTSDAPLALFGALVFVIIYALVTHWYQNLSARYHSPLQENTHQILDIHEITSNDPIEFQ